MFARRAIPFIGKRFYSQQNKASGSGTSTNSSPTPKASSSSSTNINTNVPGLSAKCVKPSSEPVGPGASTNGEYKVPEYFSYNRISYYEAEIEMARYRLPTPVADIKE